MPDENFTEDRKHVMIVDIRRKYSNDIDAHINLDLRDEHEALAALNALSETMARVMAFINKSNDLPVKVRHFHNDNLVSEELR